MGATNVELMPKDEDVWLVNSMYSHKISFDTPTEFGKPILTSSTSKLPVAVID